MVVVGSGRSGRICRGRRRADDSSRPPLLGWRLEGGNQGGGGEGGGAEADAVAVGVGVGRTLPRSHLTVNASQGSVRPWPSLPRLGWEPLGWFHRRGACELGGPAGRDRRSLGAVRLGLDLSAHECLDLMRWTL